jgi:hypothetical protein
VKRINLDVLERIINRLYKTKEIIQFSPPRSGSTLIFNILREVFPTKDIRKQHNYKYNISQCPVVISYRHPLDCIASSIQRYGLSPTDEVIKNQIVEFEKNGISDILKVKNKQNVLMIRYEEFVNDFDNIYNSIDDFFGTEISFEKRRVLTNRYQIENIEKIVESKNTFTEYDEITHWHGKHISRYKGKPYYYQDFFQNDQIEYLKQVYRKYLTEFDYT